MMGRTVRGLASSRQWCHQRRGDGDKHTASHHTFSRPWRMTLRAE